MILASLHMSGSCVEMMESSGSMNEGIYLGFCLIRFPHLSQMLSHYAQLSSSILLRLFGSIQKLKMDCLESFVSVF